MSDAYLRTLERTALACPCEEHHQRWVSEVARRTAGPPTLDYEGMLDAVEEYRKQTGKRAHEIEAIIIDMMRTYTRAPGLRMPTQIHYPATPVAIGLRRAAITLRALRHGAEIHRER